jgi:hypothetical protein
MLIGDESIIEAIAGVSSMCAAGRMVIRPTSLYYADWLNQQAAAAA